MEEETVRFGPLERWAKEKKISEQALRERVKHFPPIRARDIDEKPIDIYAEEGYSRSLPWIASGT